MTTPRRRNSPAMRIVLFVCLLIIIAVCAGLAIAALN
jgi:hypothetical protein